MRRQQGIAAYQGQVASNIQAGVQAGKLNGVLEGCPSRHQSRGREDAVAVRFQDAVVHVGREPEVVGIYDQKLRAAQKMPNLMRRNFFGLARKSFMNALISCVAPFSDS